MSVGRLMLLLSGANTQFEFLSDSLMAKAVYLKSREDIVNLGLFHDVFFFKEISLGNIDAICAVVYYKKSKLQRP